MASHPESAPNHFENSRLSVELARNPNCLVTLSISLTPQVCQQAFQTALQQVRREVSIPGFRKGKAPEEIIKTKYKKALDETWKEALAKMALKEGLTLANVYPWHNEGVNPPKIDRYSLEEGAHMELSFEADPDVPEVSMDDFQLTPVEEKSITSEEIDNEILEHRKRYCTFEKVADRPIQEKDYVTLDLEVLDETPVKKVVEGQRAEVAHGPMAKWLYEAVLGKKSGEVVETQTSLEEDADEAIRKVFHARPVRITILEHTQQKLADEETLLRAMKTDSMEDLRALAQKHLQEKEKLRIQGAIKEQLWNYLRQKYPFDVPLSLLRSKERLISEQMVSSLREMGYTDAQIREEESRIAQNAAFEARQELHALFLGREIARQAQKLPTKQEIERFASELLIWEAFSQGRSPGQYAKQRSTEEMEAYRSRAFMELVKMKAEEHLLEKVKIDIKG
jgi:trigger factor